MIPPAVVAASSPQDLLVLAAHTLGFWPQDSLVLVALHGPRRRSGLVVRADLPPLLATDPGAGVGPGGDVGLGAGGHPGLEPPGRSAVLHELVAPLADSGAQALVALVCADVDAVAPEHAELVDAVAAAAGGHRLEVAEAVLTSSSRRWSLTCERDCCPPCGVALDLDASPVAVRAVLAGSAPARSRSALAQRATAALAPAPRPERDAVEGALARLPAASEAQDAAASCTTAWWSALHRHPAAARGAAPGHRAEAAPGLSAPDPALAALLLRGARDLLVRDALMVSLMPTGARHLGLDGGQPPVGRSALTAAVQSALSDACAADHPGDEDLDRAAVALLSDLCALAPPADRAGVLALLAHLHWWWARPVHAEAVAARALALDGDHGLAVLVDALVRSCAPPDWARGPRPSPPSSRAPAPLLPPLRRRPRRVTGGPGHRR